MIPDRPRARHLRARIRALWPYVVPIIVLAVEWPLLSPYPALGDHFQFWAAGRIVAGGGSPYDREAWAAMAAYGPLPGGVTTNTAIDLALARYPWLYPPPTAFAFAPFGALPLVVGIPLLHFAVLLGAVGGVAAAARTAGLSGGRLALALTLVAVSQPFVIGVRDGHPIGVVLAGLTAAYVGARDRRALLLALGAVLVSIKPHIALAFAVGVATFLATRREWRILAWTAAALAAVVLPAELLHPFPLTAFTAAIDERRSFDLSDLAALSRDLGAGTALIVPLAALSFVAAGAAIRLAPAGHRAATAFAAALALSLVVAPYAHDYDMLLAAPASFVGLALARGARHEAALVALFGLLIGVVPTALFFWWALLDQGDRALQAGAIGALPILSLAALALACSLSPGSRSRE